MYSKPKGRISVAAVALILASCGGSASSTTMNHMDMDDHSEGFAFGEPAASSDADRTVEINANDALRFDPAEITVSAGETITFRVTNVGSIPHDFTLGDQRAQDAHAAEMAEMMTSGEMTMHDEANAVVIPAGESKELTWHFAEAGKVLIGCHQPGHYAAGMKGTVTVGS